MFAEQRKQARKGAIACRSGSTKIDGKAVTRLGEAWVVARPAKNYGSDRARASNSGSHVIADTSAIRRK
jgi:hypothetical protein